MQIQTVTAKYTTAQQKVTALLDRTYIILVKNHFAQLTISLFSPWICFFNKKTIIKPTDS